MNQRTVQDVHFHRPVGSGAMVEVIHLAKLRQRKLDHSLYAPQRRDFHLFHVVTEGSGSHHFEFGAVGLQRGDVFHIRPGQVDWFDEASDHEALLLIFAPEAISTHSALRLRLNNPLRPSVEEFAGLEELVRLIERFQRAPHLQGSALHLLRSFVSAVDALQTEVASASGSASKRALCERLDELLLEHQAQQRSVAWYSSQLGVSPKTLARATEVVFGRSPKHHIDSRVALQAKRLLVHTSDTVEDVATGLGFSEATNFVKFFRRIEGCTPQMFRTQFPADRAR